MLLQPDPVNFVPKFEMQPNVCDIQKDLQLLTVNSIAGETSLVDGYSRWRGLPVRRIENFGFFIDFEMPDTMPIFRTFVSQSIYCSAAVNDVLIIRMKKVANSLASVLNLFHLNVTLLHLSQFDVISLFLRLSLFDLDSLWLTECVYNCDLARIYRHRQRSSRLRTSKQRCWEPRGGFILPLLSLVRVL